jgi:hypothetical protein
MTNANRRCRSSRLLALAAVAATALQGACITQLEYAEPGQPLRARAHEALVVGRIRFFENGREYYPWRLSVMDYERHLWLLRLADRRATAELRPGSDGSLAVWLRPGDYALVGSEELLRDASRDQGFVAFLRVPEGAAMVIAGELTFSIDHTEGGHFRGLFGTVSVHSIPAPRVAWEADDPGGGRPATTVESFWCAAGDVRNLTGAAFEAGYRALLDAGCAPQG